jgi:PAS domain S-box-containing protein
MMATYERESRSDAQQSGGLRRRLVRSHMTVAAIGLAMLLIVFVVLWQFRAAAIRSAELRGPTARESTRALQGVQRSLAGLRGWIALGQEEFTEERASAWNDDIDPALEALGKLSPKWTNEENRERLVDVAEELATLKKAQWWIEEVAQTAGNEPARVVLRQTVEPAMNEILSSMSALIEMEEDLGSGNERKYLLGEMAQLRSQFTSSWVVLSTLVDSELEPELLGVDIAEFHKALLGARERLNEIAARPRLLTEQQHEPLATIQAELAAYEALAEEAITARQADDWHVARYLLREEAAPSAQEATLSLTEMSENQDALMRDDARLVKRISNFLVGMAVVLIGGLVLGSLYVSRNSAAQLAKPITMLSRATGQLAAGELTEDIPVTTQDELGELTRAFNTMRASLQQGEAALRASEERARQIVESAPNAMLMINRERTIELINSQTEVYFGYARDELLGQPIEMLVPERVRPRHPQNVAGFFDKPEARAMGKLQDLSGRRKDGTEFPVEIGLVPIMTEEGLKVLGSINDVTERKEAEEALRQHAKSLQTAQAAALNIMEDVEQAREELAQQTWQLQHANANLEREQYLLNSLVDNVPDPVFFKDRESCFIRANQAMADDAGFAEPSELVGRSDADIWTGELSSATLDDERRIMETGEPLINKEEQPVGQDGRRRWVLVTKMPLRDEAGEITGTFGVARDITALKEYEEELQRSNRELDDFAYVASHDLRSPLRAIHNLAKWIGEDGDNTLSEQSAGDLEKLIGRVSRMDGLLDGLLQYSRVGRKQYDAEEIDCGAMAREVAELLDRPEEFTIEVTDPMPTIRAQRVPLEQVLRNLIDNAIKHHDRADGRIVIAAEDNGAFVEFSVSDDGRGIAPEYQQKVFQIFETIKTRDEVEGSGMGLALVKKIVESFGGKIALESDQVNGATFRFTWPKSQ